MERIGIFRSNTVVHGGHAFSGGTILRIANGRGRSVTGCRNLEDADQGEGGERALCCAKNDLRYGCA
jgi:hypothetical protein